MNYTLKYYHNYIYFDILKIYHSSNFGIFVDFKHTYTFLKKDHPAIVLVLMNN